MPNQVAKIPDPGDDFLKNGFLNKAYATQVVKRLNRRFEVTPKGSGVKFLEAEENVNLDVTPLLPNDILWLAVDGVATPFQIYLKQTVA